METMPTERGSEDFAGKASLRPFLIVLRRLSEGVVARREGFEPPTLRFEA